MVLTGYDISSKIYPSSQSQVYAPFNSVFLNYTKYANSHTDMHVHTHAHTHTYHTHACADTHTHTYSVRTANLFHLTSGTMVIEAELSLNRVQMPSGSQSIITM